MEHMETIPLPTHTTLHPYYPPTTTHPYYLPTTTHPYYPLPPPTPCRNNGLERSQFIHNVYGLERSQWPCQWLVMYKCGAGAGDGSKHPPPLPPPSLEIHNVHGLERSQWPCQWLVMYKCGAGAGDGSKHPPTHTTPTPTTPSTPTPPINTAKQIPMDPEG